MTPDNEIVKGYKATDKNMQCRGFQFEIGVWHKHDGEIAMCESGFHFCEYPSGPWSFYNDKDTRIFHVEARKVIKGEAPGAELKHVAMEIRLVKEIQITGSRNTGYMNAGSRNTGDMNTGDRNTGSRNTGDMNTGYMNAGSRNTGSRNTGDMNTGYRNTGDRNTGSRNTGDMNTGDRNTGSRNTGDGNATDKCAGFLCCKPQKTIIFDKPIKENREVNWRLVNELSELLTKDDDIKNPEYFIEIPNATVKKIKALHAAHIQRRAVARN